MNSIEYPVKISILASITGVSVHRIRNYLVESLVVVEDKTAVGHQLFGKEAVIILQFIQLSREAGLSIQDIKPVIREYSAKNSHKIHQASELLREVILRRTQQLHSLNNLLNSFECTH